MSPVEEVAQAYGLTADEVRTWSTRTIDIFYRVAQARGWLLPTPTRQDTP